MSLLHYAAKVGNFSLMEPLIEEYCSHETKNSTDLFWDTEGEQVIFAKPLLEMGCHKWKKNNWTICIAIYNGHLAIFDRLFMRCGVDINVTAYSTMLNAAAISGDEMTFETLIRHMRRNGRWEHYAREYVHTTSALAAANGHQAMLELLYRELQDFSLDKRVDRLGETAISAAAANGHDHVVQFLFSKGAELAIRGMTPLHRAADNGHANVAHTLLNKLPSVITFESLDYLDPQHLVGALDSEGETPMHRAARNGHADVVQLMFEHYATSKEKWLLATASAAAKSQELIKEETALHLAAANGHIAAVELFYAHMDDRGSQGHGAKAFLAAVEGNHVELVQWLLEKGDGTEDQSYALRVAVEKGYQNLVQLFLNHLPTLVTLDLLILAAKNGHEEILEDLISTHQKGGMYVCLDTIKKLLLKVSKKAEVDQLEEAARLLEYYWRKEI
ncbi:MAG: hypothetical protein Q9180_007205 [Flavoplaca navasiana]